MTTTKSLHVGIDLGTTNSTAAVFDGETLVAVRNVAGSTLTPSVVRVSAKGTVVVGEKARRFLDQDPENTRTGFKRLMGTETTLSFAAANKRLRPEELSAEVLKSLAHDVEQHAGVRPARAVVAVPALFELPQTRATTEAAQMAGFEEIELLQEPVASALAAGWKAGSEGKWLVYDLGGGTFDASLLETSDGLLRVVGHDGDNFLGGRDFDAAIARWAADRIAREHGVALDARDPAHAGVFRRLASAAEDAKIELSRSGRATLALPEPLELGGKSFDVELAVDRATMESLVGPLVDRSIEVCLRLLRQHDVARDAIERVVLVGGPTSTPMLRARVAERVGPLAAEALDPMTIVAQGAALYAASTGLDARPRPARGALVKAAGTHELVVKAPPMSTDLMPYVVGKLADPGAPGRPTRLRLVREGATPWHGAFVDVDVEGAFAASAELIPRRGNVFRFEAQDASQSPVPVSPATVSILHGTTIGDPPVSRTIGVALANDAVKIYFEKGAPLPAKRSFTHHTVDTVAPGQKGAALRIPLVQGELSYAHLCRLIGALEIRGDQLDQVLAAGTPVEVTLELDRGGHLSATAYVPALKKVFEHVAHLVVPECSPDVLEKTVTTLLDRLATLRRDADAATSARVAAMVRELEEAERAVEAARGGDQEAAQRAQRMMLDLEGKLAEHEQERHWPELVQTALATIAWAGPWVTERCTPAEQRLFDEAVAAVERARKNKSAKDVERQTRNVSGLGRTAWLRDPQSWVAMFEDLAGDVHASRDLRKSEALVKKGREALAKGDTAALKPIVDELSNLMPVSASVRQKSYGSGVR